MPKPVSSSPFQAMEEEAYHAFREWPILLVMRQKELAMHLATVAATPAPSGAPDVAATDTRSAKQLELITRE
jgi:hypothetical protein